MRRWLTRISLALIALLLVNLSYAQIIGTNFRNISGHEKFRAISCVIGDTEATWVVDAGGITMCFVSDEGSNALPLIGRYGFAPALYRELTWQETTVVRSSSLRIGFLTKINARTSIGAPVAVRLAGTSYWPAFTLLSIAPMASVLAWSWPRVMRQFRYWKSVRLRRQRNAMGLCRCGYDLRATRHRCPECGQAIRWLPTPFPSRANA